MPITEQCGKFANCTKRFTRHRNHLRGPSVVKPFEEGKTPERRTPNGRAKSRGSDLSPAVSDHLYRIAQEAVSNALKHAHANSIEIALNAGVDAAGIVRRDPHNRECSPGE